MRMHWKVEFLLFYYIAFDLFVSIFDNLRFVLLAAFWLFVCRLIHCAFIHFIVLFFIILLQKARICGLEEKRQSDMIKKEISNEKQNNRMNFIPKL